MKNKEYNHGLTNREDLFRFKRMDNRKDSNEDMHILVSPVTENSYQQCPLVIEIWQASNE